MTVAIVRQCIGAIGAVQRPATRSDAIETCFSRVPGIHKINRLRRNDGAGKSVIAARRERLKLQFVDADDEIEKAAGCSISDIFELHGEQAFRDGERRVIQGLLDGPVKVIATGGGAFMNEATRSDKCLCAFDSQGRLRYALAAGQPPQQQAIAQTADPQATLRGLIEQRYPVYAEADLIVDSADGPRDATVDRVIDGLVAYLREAADGETEDERR